MESTRSRDTNKATDMDINTVLASSSSRPGNPTLSQTPTTSTATPTTTLMTLPTEILLQILHCLPLEVLLDFRLISSWADALVLEPVFWHRLEFSKHLLFKSGSAHRRTSFGLDRVVAPGEGALGGTGTGASAGAVVESRHRDSVFQHFSDANLITRRHTLAASLLSPTSEANGEEASPSMTISANIPRPLGSRQPALLHQLQQQQQQQQQQGDGLSTSLNVFSSTLPKTSAWTRIENSFLLFLNRLASIDRTAQGVRTVTIEDWEGVGSVQALWASLGCFLGLRSLTIRNSALRHLTAFYNRDDGDHVHGGGGGGGGGPIWAELKELALQDCLQLRSLSGIQTWLPQLQDLSLAECTSLEDFTPLVQPTSSPSSSGPKSGTREILALKRVSLIHTKIRDEELIALLRRSPGLEELRLDQCYELTVRALEAIAFGDKTPTTHAAGTAATEAAAQPGIDVTIQEAVLTPPYHTHPPTTTSSASTSTAPYPSVSGSGSYCPQLRLLSLKNCSDFTDEGIRSLVGCRHLEWLVIRGIRQVHEDTAEWLHSQGVPLRKLLSPLGRWRHWQV